MLTVKDVARSPSGFGIAGYEIDRSGAFFIVFLNHSGAMDCKSGKNCPDTAHWSMPC